MAKRIYQKRYKSSYYMLYTLWANVPSYEGRYIISIDGDVISIPRRVNVGSKERLVPKKILKSRIDRYGYITVGLNRNHVVKYHKVHRLVLAAFKGCSNLEVNHIDYDRVNNAIENLEYVTRKENWHHSRERHIAALPKGNNHWRRKNAR